MRHKRRTYSLLLQTIAQAATASRVRLSLYAQANLIEQTELDLSHDRDSAQLAEDIRWYLEDFLEDGDSPAQMRATRIRKAIEKAGIGLFRGLFESNPEGARIWKKAQKHLSLTEIQADVADPIPGVPWEIMQAPDTHTPLALSADSFVRTELTQGFSSRPEPIVRRVCRILLVISRPSGTADVAFRSIASKLFEALRSNPAFEVTVLRPPTFSACAQVLRDAARCGEPFDIVHFDGHGLHVGTDEEVSSNLPKGGYIIFEDDDGEEARGVSGREFGALIAETGTASVVLNACRSSYSGASTKGTSDSTAIAPFAIEVVRTGTCDAVAMAYNLYVSSAQRFMEEFYRLLGSGETLHTAASAARKHLATDKRRSYTAESNILDDWLVPQVFRSTTRAAFRYEPSSLTRRTPQQIRVLTANAALPPSPNWGFVGSDDGLLLIDRTFDKNKIALLYGLAGAGKTATAVEFARWYMATSNFAQTILFTSFEEPRTVDELIAPLESFLDSGQRRQKWSRSGYPSRRQIALETIDEMRFLWIWDNVDTIQQLPVKERERLLDFLRRAASTNAKFLLTARDRQEDWLDTTWAIVRMPPLRFSESVELASRVIDKLTLQNISVSLIRPILEYAQGNPLVLSIALSSFLDVKRYPTGEAAQQFVEQLRLGELAFDTEEDHGRSKALLASLRVGFERAFTEREMHRLTLLTDFRDYVNTWVVMLMCVPPVEPVKMGFADWDFGWTLPEFARITPNEIESLLVKSSRLGLLSQTAPNHFWMHPAIQLQLKTYFERFYSAGAEANRLHRAFSESVAVFSTHFAVTYSHGIREKTIEPLMHEEENLHRALSLSHENGWFQAEVGVLQGLFALYFHKGSMARWAELFSSVLPDFVDDHRRPLPGREKWWAFIMDHEWRMIFESGDLVQAEALARSILDWETANSVKIDQTHPDRFSSSEVQQLRFLAIATSRLADVLREANNPACVSMNEEAIRIYRAIGDGVSESIRLFNLGHAFKNVPALRDLTKAADYYAAAYESYPEYDALARAQCLAQLGSVSLELLGDSLQNGAVQAVVSNHLDRAINYYETALQIEPADAIANLARTHNQLGVAYQYSRTEQSKALEHFKKAIHYFNESDQWFGAAGACLNAAQVLLRLSKPHDAKDYTTEGLRILQSASYSGPQLAQAHDMLKKIEEKIRASRKAR
jgi:tetratricopeptide (TPR) repeat protein